MVLRLLHQSAFNASYVIRSYLLDNDEYKRSFIKKAKEIFLLPPRNHKAYDASGKTVGFVLNKKDSATLTVSTIMTDGFVLANGSEFVGSVMLFPHSLFSWHVLKAADVTEESLVLFKLLEPKIDILVFGYGTRNDFPSEVRENFSKICKNLGLRYEALPTEKAVGVFNFLSEERRLVAAALIPPTYVDQLKFERPHSFSELDLIEEEEQEKKLKEMELLQGVVDDKKLLK